MKKDFLRQISKTAKIDFLTKLSSGNFTLNKPYDPPPGLEFDLMENGLYKCKQTGKQMSKEEIESLSGYQISIELIRDLKEPPAGFVLIPISKEQYLDSLLKNPSEKYLNREEAKQLVNDLDAGNFEKVMRIRK